jgi:ABC-type tungstate transport system permease subunit
MRDSITQRDLTFLECINFLGNGTVKLKQNIMYRYFCIISEKTDTFAL